MTTKGDIMTKEKLIVDLCVDGILEPDQALKMLASAMGLNDEESEAFISKIDQFFKDRTGKARWTNWDDEQIVSMYGEGYLPKDIAKRLGRTVPSITQRIFLLRRNGHSLPSRRPRMIGNAYAHKEVL
jgi:hypothetical protein